VNIKESVLFIFLVALAVWIRVQDISAPFDNGLRGNCGAAYALMAENHLHYGAAATGLVPVLNTRDVDREHFVYYEHHPPGIVALTAAVFAITGSTDEAAARLLPVLFSLVTLITLFVWISRVSGTFTAFCAAALAASVPLSAYYGAFLNFETFVIPLVLISLCLYTKWVEQGGRSLMGWSLVLMAAGVLMDWTALIACVLIVLDNFVFGKKASVPMHHDRQSEPETKQERKRWAPLLYLVVGVLVFAAVKGWFAVQHARFGSPSEEGANMIRYYLDATFFNRAFSFPVFAQKLFGHFTELVTWPVLTAAAAGIVVALYGLIRTRPVSTETRSVLILLAWGTCNIVFFAMHAARHEYWILLLYPAICWCAALTGEKLTRLLHGNSVPSFKGKAAAAVLFAGMAVFGAFRTFSIMDERRGNSELYQRGLAYKALASKNNPVVFTPSGEPIQVIYYSGGAVYPYGVPTPDALEARRTILEKYGYINSPGIFVVRRKLADKFKASLGAFGEIAEPVEDGEFIVFGL